MITSEAASLINIVIVGVVISEAVGFTRRAVDWRTTKKTVRLQIIIKVFLVVVVSVVITFFM